MATSRKGKPKPHQVVSGKAAGLLKEIAHRRRLEAPDPAEVEAAAARMGAVVATVWPDREACPAFFATALHQGFVPEPPAVPAALTQPTALLPLVQPHRPLGLANPITDRDEE